MTLTIRQEQLGAFARARYQDFEARTTAHLREFFPEKVNAMPADGLRAFIRRCVDRAGTFGLESEQAVVCYAHLLLLLGEDFESDPRWAFVPSVLRQEEYPANDRAKLTMLLVYGLRERGL